MMSFRQMPARTLAAVAMAASFGGTVAACGTGSPAPAKTVTRTVQAGSGGGNASASSAPAATTPAGPAGCLASGLQAQLGAAQGAAGTHYQVIELVNTSAATCTLYGYPGVSFVTGIGGSQVGAPANHAPGTSKSLVTLSAGGKANFLLAVHDAGAFPQSRCHMTNVGWLRIYPPGDYGAVYVQYQTQACARPSLSIMEVGPVRAGAGNAQ